MSKRKTNETAHVVVRWDTEWEEFTVAYKSGVGLSRADIEATSYFTTCGEDAVDSMNYMEKDFENVLSRCGKEG